MKRTTRSTPTVRRLVRPSNRTASVLLGIAGVSIMVGISDASAKTADPVAPCAIEWDCVSSCAQHSGYSDSGIADPVAGSSNGETVGVQEEQDRPLRDGWYAGLVERSSDDKPASPPGERWPLVMTFDDLASMPQIGGWIHQYIWSYLDAVMSS